METSPPAGTTEEAQAQTQPAPADLCGFFFIAVVVVIVHSSRRPAETGGVPRSD